MTKEEREEVIANAGTDIANNVVKDEDIKKRRTVCGSPFLGDY